MQCKEINAFSFPNNILDWETLTAIYISRWGNVLTRKATIKGNETLLKKKFNKIANIDFSASKIMNQPERRGTHVKHAYRVANKGMPYPPHTQPLLVPYLFHASNVHILHMLY